MPRLRLLLALLRIGFTTFSFILLLHFHLTNDHGQGFSQRNPPTQYDVRREIGSGTSPGRPRPTSSAAAGHRVLFAEQHLQTRWIGDLVSTPGRPPHRRFPARVSLRHDQKIVASVFGTATLRPDRATDQHPIRQPSILRFTDLFDRKISPGC